MKLCCTLPTRFFISIKFFTLLVFSCVTTLVNAEVFDSYFLEVGRGVHAKMYKLGAKKEFAKENAFLVRNNLRTYMEFSVAKLLGSRYENIEGRTQSLTNVGITPVLRWQKNGFFGEIGVGLNYMSDRYNNGGKTAGTKFQFGDLIGIGYQFNEALDITLRLQHFSNAGIAQPNPAINFSSIQLSYAF
jgi:lipid A 3-O-deacylase